MVMISCSNANDLKGAFHILFKESTNYLGRTYLGNVHSWAEN
jgi:hypothetical protein